MIAASSTSQCWLSEEKAPFKPKFRLTGSLPKYSAIYVDSLSILGSAAFYKVNRFRLN